MRRQVEGCAGPGVVPRPYSMRKVSWGMKNQFENQQKGEAVFVAIVIIILAVLLIPESGKGSIDDDFNKTRGY